MLTLKNFPKALVQYAKAKDKLIPVLVKDELGEEPVSYVQFEGGKKFGVIVALDNGILGWSLCNKKDSFDKDKGLAIALGRASLASEMTSSERFDFYQRVPESLADLFEEMKDRAKKYYQDDYEKYSNLSL